MITLEQVRAWHPCPDYTDARLAELAAGRKSITVAEALDLPIPASDRVWLLVHPGALPDVIRREWVEVVVSRAVRAHALACGVAEVEDWAARWFADDPTARTRAVTSSDLAAQAATRATWAAEAMADGKAAAALAWAADAYDVAAKEAVRAGARPLTWTLAWATERERQIADLRAILAAHAATA